MALCPHLHHCSEIPERMIGMMRARSASSCLRMRRAGPADIVHYTPLEIRGVPAGIVVFSCAPFPSRLTRGLHRRCRRGPADQPDYPLPRLHPKPRPSLPDRVSMPRRPHSSEQPFRIMRCRAQNIFLQRERTRASGTHSGSARSPHSAHTGGVGSMFTEGLDVAIILRRQPLADEASPAAFSTEGSDTVGLAVAHV